MYCIEKKLYFDISGQWECSSKRAVKYQSQYKYSLSINTNNTSTVCTCVSIAKIT